MSDILWLMEAGKIVTYDDWRTLFDQKIKTVQELIKAKQWVPAGEYMGYALECALKAVTCKTLGKDTYPPLRLNAETNEKKNKITRPFMVHEFDYLLIFSGLTPLFKEHFAWNEFSKRYSGAWSERRYDIDIENYYTENVVLELYNFLYDDKDSIIKTIDRAKKW